MSKLTIKVKSVFCLHCKGNLIPAYDEMNNPVPKCILCGREWPTLVPGYVPPIPFSDEELKTSRRRATSYG